MEYLKEELAIKKPVGNRIGFPTNDGVWRFRDADSGVWRRYSINCLDKERKARKGWGSDGTLNGEGENTHFTATNGTKVFMFPKDIVKEVGDGK